MRILHVYKAYPPVVGGMENHIRTLAEAQAAAGHHVTVLVTSRQRRGARDRLGGVDVIRAGKLLDVSSAPVSLALVGELRRQTPDVTHLHCPYPVGEAAWLAVGRAPMVLTYQSDIVRQRLLGRLWAPGLRLVLRRADRIIATSPQYAASSPFLRAARERVTVVPLGIDTHRFETANQHPRSTGGDGAGRILFVGRLRYYKGLDILLRSLALVPGARLAIVGAGPEGPALRDQAARCGVADRVDWLGEVGDAGLLDALAEAEVFVLPSTARSEAFGLAMVEAMAAGLPVVSTELGTGTSWINQDGVTGLVVAPRDPQALAAALRKLLLDGETRSRMGQAARLRAATEFDVAVMMDRVESIYREVAA